MPRTTTRLFALGFATLCAAAGCESLRGLGRPEREAALTPAGEIQPREASQLVAYLNERAARLNSLQYNRVSMSVDADGKTYQLGSTKLACEKPRNFSIIGGKALMDELVVLGSNDREFWVYTRFPERTYLYCSHADLPAVATKLPLPFDPDWAMQALGMLEYPPNRDYQVEVMQQEREYHLSYPHTAPGGQPVRVTVVFAALKQPEYSPQVRRLIVEDATTNQVVATAEIKSASPGTGVPMQIVLSWPQQKTVLDLDLGEPIVNPVFDNDLRNYCFTRRDMGVEAIDLKRVQFRGSARGQAPTNAGSPYPPQRRRFGR